MKAERKKNQSIFMALRKNDRKFECEKGVITTGNASTAKALYV